MNATSPRIRTKLPKHVTAETTRHGRRIFYFRREKGERIRLPDDRSSPEFLAAYEGALSMLPTEDVRHMPKTPTNLRKKRVERVIRGAMRSARTRSRTKGVPFDIDIDFLLREAAAQDFKCALTGIEFFAKNNTKSRVDPYTPSIDRIVPSLGYVKGNVRLVIYAVNAMILDWGEPLFIRIANSYRYWGRTKNARPSPAPTGIRPHQMEIPMITEGSDHPFFKGGAVERNATFHHSKPRFSRGCGKNRAIDPAKEFGSASAPFDEVATGKQSGEFRQVSAKSYQSGR